MAILELPTRTDLSVYDFTIELDEVVFTYSFFFNTRSNHWYLNILDIDGNPLREGIKIVSNWPLLVPWTQQGRPAGEMVSASPQTDDDPDRETFGTASVLTYDEGGAFG